MLGGGERVRAKKKTQELWENLQQSYFYFIVLWQTVQHEVRILISNIVYNYELYLHTHFKEEL